MNLGRALQPKLYPMVTAATGEKVLNGYLSNSIQKLLSYSAIERKLTT